MVLCSIHVYEVMNMQKDNLKNVFIMCLSQFCKNKLQTQNSIIYQAQYIAKKYMQYLDTISNSITSIYEHAKRSH